MARYKNFPLGLRKPNRRRGASIYFMLLAYKLDLLVTNKEGLNQTKQHKKSDRYPDISRQSCYASVENLYIVLLRVIDR